MSKRKKDVIWVVVLSIACGLVTWHAVHWYSTGVYLDMFNWLQTGKSYITVLYNLGLMLVVGVLLGFLIGKIGSLVSGYQQKEEGDALRREH